MDIKLTLIILGITFGIPVVTYFIKFFFTKEKEDLKMPFMIIGAGILVVIVLIIAMYLFDFINTITNGGIECLLALFVIMCLFIGIGDLCKDLLLGSIQIMKKIVNR